MKRSLWPILVAGTFVLAFLWHAVGGIGETGRGGTVSAGDSNGDGTVNISDALHLLNYLFSSGPAPATCQGGGSLPATDITFDAAGTSFTTGTVQAALGEVDERLQALSTADTSLSVRVEALEGDVEIALVAIPAGTFTMGSPPTELGRRNEETEHVVHLTKPFLLGVYEITQAQFEAVMGWNPSLFSGCPTCPAESVNWFDAKEFVRKLTIRHHANGTISENSFYRLPTEAEWEYACRAGTTTRFSFGDAAECGESQSCEAADPHMWYTGNNTTANYGPKPVGLKQPNAWGLYDMYGNVSEWCQDVFAPFQEGEVTDPTGADPTTDTTRLRVSRGGTWNLSFPFQRSAGWRFAYFPERRDNPVPTGIRVVLEVQE